MKSNLIFSIILLRFLVVNIKYDEYSKKYSKKFDEIIDSVDIYCYNNLYSYTLLN